MPAIKDKGSWPSHVKFTKAVIERFERSDCEGKQRTVWDTEQRGLCVLVSPSSRPAGKNTVTLRCLYYLDAKPRYVKIGRHDEKVHYRDVTGKLHELKCWDMDAVRRRASDIRNAAKGAGIDPKKGSASGNVGELIEQFIDEQKKRIRTASETERIFRRYVVDEWRHKAIGDIAKADITNLLNRLESGKFKGPKGRMLGTPIVADAVRAQLSKFFTWYAEDHDDKFASPFVKVKRRSKDMKRDRTLTDAEIAAMWNVCDTLGVYGACVQTALVTAQRFHKVSEMRRSQVRASVTIPGRFDELTGDWIEDQVVENVWDARTPDDPDNKQVSEVPLSPLAKSIIDRVPIIDANARDHVDYVFSLNGKKPFNGWSNAKEQLDAKMAEILGDEVQPWQHRDLRRTARTLLSRAGVSRDISEHCLAHVIGGVEGVYDRHDYLVEKREAFARLAKLVDRIVNPPEATNVVKFGRS